MTICKKCWKVFTTNLFGVNRLAPLESIEIWKSREGKPASDYFISRDEVQQRRISESTIYVAISSNLTSEQFDYVQKNKNKLVLIGLRNEWVDELGFTHVDWA